MLTLKNIMMGSAKPKELAKFYAGVMKKKPDWSDGGWYGWEMGDFHFAIGEHSKAKGKSKDPVRIILNFESTQVKKEFQRIKKLGAKVIKKPYEMEGAWIVTFADPDGNYFQLVSPWKGMK